MGLQVLQVGYVQNIYMKIILICLGQLAGETKKLEKLKKEMNLNDILIADAENYEDLANMVKESGPINNSRSLCKVWFFTFKSMYF